MTIIEAIKSGKAFKRKKWCAAYLIKGKGQWLRWKDSDVKLCLTCKKINLTIGDILADDWIVREE